MLRKSIAAFALATLGLSAGAGFAQPAPTVQQVAPRKSKRGLFGGFTLPAPRFYGTRGAGITMAQQQRAARKARNARRHKAHVRGVK